MRNRRLARLALPGAALAALFATACVIVDAEDSGSGRSRHEASSAGPVARARIDGKSGSSLTGTATFTEREGGVSVVLRVSKAPPGWHAVHVHEKGDCSADDGSSAGGHFNPASHAHGSPHAPEHHAGDLGNMWVDESGNGYHEIFMPDLTVKDGPSSVRGRAIVVHAGADDLISQPTGAAGGRIGCGVIQ